MIEVKKLKKKYGDKTVLKSISFQISDPGFYAVMGNSGTGKSTLFHLLGLLDFEYDGLIMINGKDIQNCSNDEVLNLRESIGYVYQDYQLLNDQTVLDNLNFINNDKEKIKNVLYKVHLNGYENQIVNTLSGGEKQRLSIARTLIHQPLFLLLDEPTGSLDENNKNLVMKLLKEISKEIIVLIISHDFLLVNHYCDQMMILKDGILENTIHQNGSIEIHGTKKKRTKSIYQSVAEIKGKKKFSYFIISILVLSNLLLGFSFSFKSTMSQFINSSFHNIFPNEEIEISNKNSSSYERELISINKETLKEIKSEKMFSSYRIYTNYFIDYDYIFKDGNSVECLGNAYHITFNSLQLKDFMEFDLIEEITSDVYPKLDTELKDNEFIMSLTLNELYRIEASLGISDHSIYGLSHYLENNHVYFCLNLENDDWEYQDEIILELKGFLISDQLKIYHSNSFFNESLFEKEMEFPVNTILNISEIYPWVVKKCYGILVDDVNKEKFLEDLVLSKDYFYIKPYYLSTLGKNLFYLTYDFDSNKILNLSHKIKEKDYIADFSFSNSFFMNINGGLSSGFVLPTFLSTNYNELVYFSDNNYQSDKFLNSLNMNYESINDNLLSCSIIDNNKNNFVRWNFEKPVIQYGREIKNNNELIISKGLAALLFNQDDYLYKNIYFLSLKQSVKKENYYYNDFFLDTFKIVGITEEEKYQVYQNNFWVFSYPLLNNLKSTDFLYPEKIIVNPNVDSKEALKNLKSELVNYVVECPLLEIKANSLVIIQIIQNGLMVFSSSLFFCTSLIYIMVIYYFLKKSKRNIVIYFSQGKRVKEIKKIYQTSIILLSVLSVVLAFAILNLIYFSLGGFLKDTIGELVFIFPFKTCMCILLVNLFLSFIISNLFIRKINAKEIIFSIKTLS